ncbi:hypothetical protein DFS34DRAFT_649888 [Phlyctochytrium arcticum]|nr:hypothetical protein DFS34DRAFT_649888 [Phlyctochytrium arcticum]
MAVAICSIEQFRDSATLFDAGDMNCECRSCGAFRWKAEKASICCHNGKTKGDDVGHVSPHAALQPLFSGATNDSKEFLAHIRKYNQAFAFTSMSSNLDLNLASDRDGIYTFRVNGELYGSMTSTLQTRTSYFASVVASATSPTPAITQASATTQASVTEEAVLTQEQHSQTAPNLHKDHSFQGITSIRIPNELKQTFEDHLGKLQRLYELGSGGASITHYDLHDLKITVKEFYARIRL